MQPGPFTLVRLGMVLLAAGSLMAQTAFNYQGQLQVGGSAATGTYDFQFSLYDSPTNGTLVGAAFQTNNLTVAQGVFQTLIDFGPVFDGQPRWLEIGIRPGGTADAFTSVSPRQPILSTPQATYAASAGTLQAGAEPLEFTANNVRVLRLEGTANSPNIIGGSGANAVTAGVVGSTIGGGGTLDYQGTPATNAISANYSTIGGGVGNSIEAVAAVVGGGFQNRVRANAFSATIAGGENNVILNSANRATIAGGNLNQVGTNATWSTVGGGRNNLILSDALASVIAGGETNRIGTNATYATIGGGFGNSLLAGDSVIGGGAYNRILEGAFDSTIAGGAFNAVQSSAGYSVIGGGRDNNIQGASLRSTIGGGAENTVRTNAVYSTISGGYRHIIDANASYATVPGGRNAFARDFGQLAYSAGGFSLVGDAQTSQFLLRRTTTNAAPAELFLDGDLGGNRRITLPAGAMWAFDILITAGSTNGEMAAVRFQGAIKNTAGTTSLVGTPTGTVLGADAGATWANGIQVAADNTNRALTVQVTGTDAPLRWVAAVRTSELLFSSYP